MCRNKPIFSFQYRMKKYTHHIMWRNALEASPNVYTIYTNSDIEININYDYNEGYWYKAEFSEIQIKSLWFKLVRKKQSPIVSMILNPYKSFDLSNYITSTKNIWYIIDTEKIRRLWVISYISLYPIKWFWFKLNFYKSKLWNAYSIKLNKKDYPYIIFNWDKFEVNKYI